jgi:hypothetical protein
MMRMLVFMLRLPFLGECDLADKLDRVAGSPYVGTVNQVLRDRPVG